MGDAIRFHPTLLACAGHYRYEPRPVAVARGNEKGRVERAIRYTRDNFFAAREFRDLDELNAQATAWCRGPAAERPCPEDHRRSVAAVFAAEQPRLLALPANPFPTEERVAVKAGKTPYVRFDRNDYSIPHDRVQRTLTVLATPTAVRIVEGAAVLAQHVRSYDQGAQIEDPTHLQALVDHKRAAHPHRGTDRLAAAVPQSRELLTQAARKGDNSPRPRARATTWAPSPPRCCGCWNVMAPPNWPRPSMTRSPGRCRIPTRCAWLWSDAARHVTSHRPSGSRCRRR